MTRRLALLTVIAWFAAGCVATPADAWTDDKSDADPCDIEEDLGVDPSGSWPACVNSRKVPLYQFAPVRGPVRVTVEADGPVQQLLYTRPAPTPTAPSGGIPGPGEIVPHFWEPFPESTLDVLHDIAVVCPDGRVRISRGANMEEAQLPEGHQVAVSAFLTVGEGPVDVVTRFPAPTSEDLAFCASAEVTTAR